jgi:hypothetical protein
MDAEKLKEIVLSLLDETFQTHHGIYTNRGTSLMETLATIDAAEASVPVGGQCPTLAAQVAHTAFYLEVLEKGIRGEDDEAVDWEHIWNTVNVVTPEEWEASKAHLAATYQRIRAEVAGFDSWNEDRLYVLAIIAHSAYHLGGLRQALCIVKAARGTDGG